MFLSLNLNSQSIQDLEYPTETISRVFYFKIVTDKSEAIGIIKYNESYKTSLPKRDFYHQLISQKPEPKMEVLAIYNTNNKHIISDIRLTNPKENVFELTWLENKNQKKSLLTFEKECKATIEENSSIVTLPCESYKPGIKARIHMITLTYNLKKLSTPNTLEYTDTLSLFNL